MQLAAAAKANDVHLTLTGVTKTMDQIHQILVAGGGHVTLEFD
jgi:hypothetical protein